MIDLTRLRELLEYNPGTGLFTRKVSFSNRVKVGDIAGSEWEGYIYVYVDGHKYAAHRLAWFHFYGVWPTGLLDHRDLKGTNNAIGNLRPSEHSGNGANRGVNKNNLLGLKGVSKHPKGYIARIRVKRKQMHLGLFQDPVKAAQAYDTAAVQHFGDFALTNKSLGYI